MNHLGQPEVHVLMGTFNGASFLEAQLESLSRQTHRNWRLTCSDDGSTDSTLDTLSRFAARSDRPVMIAKGPRQGFSRNFLSLVLGLAEPAGLIAFADQDDIWLPEKLERAVKQIGAFDARQPVIYGSATWIWDSETDHRQSTPALRRPPTFANALIENFATGNTMVLNSAAVTLLREATHRIGSVYAHDWWSYALLSGSGAHVIFDDAPTVLYRQHRQNEIGAGESFWKRQRRNLAVADGRYRTKVGQNVSALSAVVDMLTPENARLLAAFAAARDARRPISRLRRMLDSGVYRQSRRDMVGFWGATLLGKV